MKARGTKTRPAREPVVESVGDAEKRRPFLATGADNTQSVMMRVSSESEVGLIFNMANGEINEIDFGEEDENWTFDRYLTESESVQIVGG